MGSAIRVGEVVRRKQGGADRGSRAARLVSEQEQYLGMSEQAEEWKLFWECSPVFLLDTLLPVLQGGSSSGKP